MHTFSQTHFPYAIKISRPLPANVQPYITNELISVLLIVYIWCNCDAVTVVVKERKFNKENSIFS